jgi:hypothetical protein
MESQQQFIRLRPGFGILVVVVMVAIVAAAMAATIPALIRLDRTVRVQKTAQILTDLDTLILSNTAGFKNFTTSITVGPSRLSHLTTPITTAGVSCNTGLFSAANVASWVTWGPFGAYYIAPGAGLATPIGTANDLMVHAGSGASQTLAIVFPNIDFPDVDALDQYMDAGNGSAAGLVQWTAPAANGTTTMSYVMPVGTKC